MLKNRRYIGEYKFQDIVHENGIPAIVPKDLFNKVQEELAKNKRAAARHKAEADYLLTTKLFCGKCGVYMTGESGTGRNGTVHRYYKCNNVKYKHSCDKKPVKKDWIEDLVIKHTKEMMMQDDVIEDIANIVLREAKADNTALKLLQQQLSEIERRIANILSAMEDGITTKTTKQRLVELEETKEEIELKIVKEELKRPTLTKECLMFWLQRFRNMDVTKREHTQRLINSFVNAVYLYDDKLVLTFNYKDANKTVTLEEVNGSIIECQGAPKRERPKGPLSFWYQGSGENPSKCNSPVDCCMRPAGRAELYNFCPSGKNENRVRAAGLRTFPSDRCSEASGHSDSPQGSGQRPAFRCGAIPRSDGRRPSCAVYTCRGRFSSVSKRTKKAGPHI